MVFFDHFIRLIDVVIWPVTLLIILSWFRKELQGFFKNLKKIEAGADGVVFESFEQQLSKTRELFPATIASKSSASIDEGEVRFKRDVSLSTSDQAKRWNKELSELIVSESSRSSSSPLEALEELKSTGKIRFHEYQKRKALLKLTSVPLARITEDILGEIQNYLNELTF